MSAKGWEKLSCPNKVIWTFKLSIELEKVGREKDGVAKQVLIAIANLRRKESNCRKEKKRAIGHVTTSTLIP
jgi:hypothetical protein